MSEQASYIELFELFAFDEDAAKCRCRGSGWALSELDTWHKCRIHWKNHKDTPHPEDDGIPDYCPECGDGDTCAPDRCSLCGEQINAQRADGWNDLSPGVPLEVPTTDDDPDCEIPF